MLCHPNTKACPSLTPPNRWPEVPWGEGGGGVGGVLGPAESAPLGGGPYACPWTAHRQAMGKPWTGHGQALGALLAGHGTPWAGHMKSVDRP